MLCDECKKRPANVRITKITNNKKVERNLCQQCAQAAGEISFTTDDTFSVHDFLKGMFSFGFDSPHTKSESACACCGMTYSDFSRSGKIGCANCYSTFGDRLEPLLRRIHGTSMHTGKIPGRTGGTLQIKQQLKQLREQLERHVSREEYEQAARLRDQIRELEKKLES